MIQRIRTRILDELFVTFVFALGYATCYVMNDEKFRKNMKDAKDTTSKAFKDYQEWKEFCDRRNNNDKRFN